MASGGAIAGDMSRFLVSRNVGRNILRTGRLPLTVVVKMVHMVLVAVTEAVGGGPLMYPGDSPRGARRV